MTYKEEMEKEDIEYFRGMAICYGEYLDKLYDIVYKSDWINIGTKPKRAIEKMAKILQEYKKPFTKHVYDDWYIPENYTKSHDF